MRKGTWPNTTNARQTPSQFVLLGQRTAFAVHPLEVEELSELIPSKEDLALSQRRVTEQSAFPELFRSLMDALRHVYPSLLKLMYSNLFVLSQNIILLRIAAAVPIFGLVSLRPLVLFRCIQCSIHQIMSFVKVAGASFSI
jgi:hypothetical protein